MGKLLERMASNESVGDPQIRKSSRDGFDRVRSHMEVSTND